MDSATFNVIVVIIYVICIPGVCFSFTAFCIICSRPSFHNAFGYLSAADVIAEGGLILNFLASTTLALMIPSSVDTTFMASLGYFSIFIHRFLSYIQFVKSFNRFFAVVFYWKYSTFFNYKNTLFLIALSIGISIFHTFSYFGYSCNLLYNLSTLGWSRRDPTCVVFGVEWSFNMVIILYAGSIICNVLTISYLHCKSKKMVAQKRKLSWIEKRFLLQTSTTSIIYILALCCRYLVTPLGYNVILKYMLSSGCWIFFCMINEIIFVMSTINLKHFFTQPNSISTLFTKS